MGLAAVRACRAGDRFWGRGAADDKGHLVSRLAALDVARARSGELPYRVVFVVEGEEEIGSPHLDWVLEQHADRLSPYACVWEVGGVDVLGNPVADLGVGGIVDGSCVCGPRRRAPIRERSPTWRTRLAARLGASEPQGA